MKSQAADRMKRAKIAAVVRAGFAGVEFEVLFSMRPESFASGCLIVNIEQLQGFVEVG